MSLASSPVRAAKTFLRMLNLLFVFFLPSFARVAGWQLQTVGGRDCIEILIRPAIVSPKVLNRSVSNLFSPNYLSAASAQERCYSCVMHGREWRAAVL